MLEHPVSVTFETEQQSKNILIEGNCCQWDDMKLCLTEKEGETHIQLCAMESRVCFVSIRFQAQIGSGWRILGDEWERTYGDMVWMPFVPHRRLPWYFLMAKKETLYGVGVKVRPNAMCFWQADEDGITLTMDVRCGGRGITLEGRELETAVLVSCGYERMSRFEAARLFCKKMCGDGIFPEKPVYGSNNWYYAYGDISHEQVKEDAIYLKKLTGGIKNRPYLVVDDGWQKDHILEEYNGGPWRNGNKKFPDMSRLADEIISQDIIPGIWIRLLLNHAPEISKEQRLSHNGCLDPSHPAVLDYIEEDVRTLCKWGYRLIKHDFSTYDILGKWGFEMQPYVTDSGWNFYNTKKTTAEIIKEFYKRIYETAKGYGCLILGCNTIGHLGAGMMHLNRTGDDTSGLRWSMTRRNGINALAFRMPQHGIFYDADADCVGIAGNIEWKWNRQWTELLAESGTSLFISAKPGILSSHEETELKQFMKLASEHTAPAEPLDWEYTSCPRQWKTQEGIKEFKWYEV